MNSKQQTQVNSPDPMAVLNEPIADVPLLIAQMIKMGLREILDRHIAAHWRQRKLSWGWTAVVWLAYAISEGDHRKVALREYVEGMQETLRRVTGQDISPLDFDDDRLSHLLTHLSKKSYWEKIERDLSVNSIEVFDLPQDIVRCDATTISGLNAVEKNGLMQYGVSKDDASKPQVKLMSGGLDPLGMPLASNVVSGERADDGLYVPLIERICECLDQKGLLFVGDCKMSAIATRGHVVASEHYYLMPLPSNKNMEGWIDNGVQKKRDGVLVPVIRVNDKDESTLIAQGYELTRALTYQQGDRIIDWEERVLVIHSPAHAARQAVALEKRLDKAERAIRTLTPPRGRGKRQITDEETIQTSIQAIIAKYRTETFLDVTYERQVEKVTKFVGKGRGSANRKTHTQENVRYQITSITRSEKAIDAKKERFGWKAFVTNASLTQISLSEAVLTYRKEYRVERIFQRLKSRLTIAPFYLKRDDQIEGLTYLLTLGVRVLTLLEFVVRRSLRENNEKLHGMHLENRKKATDKPTAERILKAFSKITTSTVLDASGKVLLRYVTPLNLTQKIILKSLGLNEKIYQYDN